MVIANSKYIVSTKNELKEEAVIDGVGIDERVSTKNELKDYYA